MGFQIIIGYPGQPLSLDELGEGSIIFLDLDEFDGASIDEKAERVLDWVKDQCSRAQDLNPIIPCIVVIGASDLESETAIKTLMHAGVIFHIKPEGYDKTRSEAAKINLLERWMEDIRLGCGLIDTLPLPLPNKRSANDLSAYFDPPYPISTDDYERLLRRLRMPDDDWKKDD